MFGNMMERLQEMQQKTEDAKRRLENITVTGEAPADAVVVEMTGNRKIKNISINVNLKDIEKEELEDLIVLATAKALENAENVFESEMKSVASGLLPGM
jgi:DNA-binding YbaB/EbfC family protein